MSVQQGLQVVGTVVGSYFGYPQLGFMLGSLAASFVPPEGPDPGDLTRPQISAGSPMWRGYGDFKRTLSPIWMSDFRAVETGGKGSEPPGVFFTIDVLYFAIGKTDVDAILRVWVNEDLKYSMRDGADADTLRASLTTTAWESIELRDGNPAQTPWSVHEDAEGAGNVSAQRGFCTIAIRGLNCGGSKTLPFVKAELSTNATSEIVDVSTDDLVLQFSDADGITVSFPGVGLTDQEVYTGAELDHAQGAPWALECDILVVDGPVDNVLGPVFLSYGYAGEFFELGCYGSAAYATLNTNYFGNPDFTSSHALSGTPSSSATVRVEMGRGFPTAVLTFSINGAVVYTDPAFPNPAGSGTITVGLRQATTISGHHGYSVSNVNFYAPDVADAVVWTPAPVTLSSIIDHELGMNEAIDLADWDTSECDDILVNEYQCSGTPAAAINGVCDPYFVDLVPGNPLRFVPRGQAVVATLTNAELGVGVGKSGEAFTGLMEDNDDEQSAIAGIQFPDRLNNHDPGYRSSDRLTTQSPSAKNLSTLVGFLPSEAQGRAIAFNLLKQSARYTAEISWSDRRAAIQPGDAILVPDELGNVYELLVRADTFAEGVHKVKVELNDVSALVYTGVTTEIDRNAVTVVGPAVITPVLIDSPIFRDADNGYGIYATLTASGDWTSATVLKSSDGLTYTNVGTLSNQGIVGEATALANFTGWGWDTSSSMTVVLAEGSTALSSSTVEAVEADASINVALVGAHGRWEAIRFVNASLITASTYLLSNFLRGQFGTEAHNGSHVAGDTFVQMRTTGVLRIPGDSSDIGAVRYYKFVPSGQSSAAVDAVEFTTAEVGLKPYATVDLAQFVEDDLSGVEWNRRSRLSYPVAATSQPPIGEDSESYDVDLYDPTDVLVSTDTVTTNRWYAGSSAAFENFIVPMYDIREISSEMVGVREDSTAVGSENFKFVRQTIAGGLIAESALLGNLVYQTVTDGDELYACTADTLNPPGAYINSKIKRITRTSLGTVAATYTAATPGDLHGVAYDGTDIWATEWYSGNLRQLNKTTLASIATHALDVQLGRLYHYSGDLWICSDYAGEVIQWDIGTATETQRFTTVTGPTELLLVGTLLFVRGATEIGVYTAATGALVTTVAAYNYGRGLYEFGSYVIAVASYGVVLIDKTTGAEFLRVSSYITYGGTSYTYFRSLAGIDGTTFYMTLGGPGLSNQTIGFDLDAASLTGYTIKVYQNSATVGRGYVAELEL